MDLGHFSCILFFPLPVSIGNHLLQPFPAISGLGSDHYSLRGGDRTVGSQVFRQVRQVSDCKSQHTTREIVDALAAIYCRSSARD